MRKTLLIAAALAFAQPAWAQGAAPVSPATSDPSKPLAGKRVAILVDDGFEQVEMTQPRAALDAAGATTILISPQSKEVRAWNLRDWGETFPVNVGLGGSKGTSASDYDALLLPGGTMNPDLLRTDAQAVQFVRSFFDAGLPVAAICHGLWTLAEADVIRGHTLTSWPSLHTDLENAGATWVNREVVVDGKLVTSRMPADIPVFNAYMIPVFAGLPTPPMRPFKPAVADVSK